MFGRIGRENLSGPDYCEPQIDETTRCAPIEFAQWKEQLKKDGIHLPTPQRIEERKTAIREAINFRVCSASPGVILVCGSQAMALFQTRSFLVSLPSLYVCLS